MGAVVADAGVLIGVLEPADLHHAASVEVFRRAETAGQVICVPASAISEALVGAALRGESTAREMVARIERAGVRVVDINTEVATQAALLRATHKSLRLPDALVIAAARALAADELVTTDRRWPSKKALKFAGELTVL